MDEQYLLRELRHFLDADGRLKGYPAKNRLKLMSLFYLASKFENGRSYSENEVNRLLEHWHTFSDWAMLRRDLYDKKFIGREADGSKYWLENEPPSPASLGIIL